MFVIEEKQRRISEEEETKKKKRRGRTRRVQVHATGNLTTAGKLSTNRHCECHLFSAHRARLSRKSIQIKRAAETAKRLSKTLSIHELSLLRVYTVSADTCSLQQKCPMGHHFTIRQPHTLLHKLNARPQAFFFLIKLPLPCPYVFFWGTSALFLRRL